MSQQVVSCYIDRNFIDHSTSSASRPSLHPSISVTRRLGLLRATDRRLRTAA